LKSQKGRIAMNTWRCPVCTTFHETLPAQCSKCGRLRIKRIPPEPAVNIIRAIKIFGVLAASLLVLVIGVSLTVSKVSNYLNSQAQIKAKKAADEKAWQERIAKLDAENKEATRQLLAKFPDALSRSIPDIRQGSSSLQSLHNELIGFKDSDSFGLYGFSSNGPYHSWMTRVENMSRSGGFKNRQAFSELAALGRSYASSRGRETKSTQIFSGFMNEHYGQSR
jgi:hypothetical protein